jgi:dienelactone hydrolase
MTKASAPTTLVAMIGSSLLGPMIWVSEVQAQQPLRQTVIIGQATFECATPAVNIDGVDAMRSFKEQQSWQPNNQWAAAVVAPFAAASYDTYEHIHPDAKSRALRLDDGTSSVNDGKYGQTGWRRWKAWGQEGRTENPDNGLVYDVYYRDGPSDRLDLMIAYRGTVGAKGWVANFSWITQWFHRGQYQQAKDEFPLIMEQAVMNLAKGRQISITTVGHSLGGGLARHVATHFECTSFVVFNSSFVTNDLAAKNTPPVQVFVYEKGDPFERLISGNVRNTSVNATYRVTVSDIPAKHNMERLAVGASRMGLDCDRNTPRCEVPKKAVVVAESLFCDRYVKLRFDLGDKAQKQEMLKMRESTSFCPSHKDMK